MATLALLAAACHAAPRADVAPSLAAASQSCAGDRSVVVRNNTDSAVEVYVVKGTAEAMLGTAGPGRSEFAIESDAQRFRARRPGSGTVIRGVAAQRASSPVTFTVACKG